MVDLSQDIQFIKGVGPNRAVLLRKLGINNLEDLITYYPRSYEDRSKPIKIADAEDDEEVLIEAVVVSKVNEIRTRRRNMTIYKLIVRDETDTCVMVWYNQSYLKSMFKIGQKCRFFGKISKKSGVIQMTSPVYDFEGKDRNTGKIIPLYPLTYKLKQNTIRQIIETGLKLIENDKLKETLPDYILKENKLLDINTAIKKIHFPENFEDFSQAKKRLVYEELIDMQMLLLSLKNKYSKKEKGIQFSKDAKMSDVINELPFKLTKAQLRVLEEIDKDMESDKVMNRLLQGDVGSGKTAVAMIAGYKAVKSGYQMTIMAPTAILAAQHLESFERTLGQFGIKCELLVGSVTKKKKEAMLERLKNGEIDILIGTHALLEENVVFKNLGLVVTDEQHRFGVRQRGIISNKGNNPDVLVMTATPIPRTLALILYGDLDISIIDELPPNRKEIKTHVIRKAKEQALNSFVREQVKQGRQAYIVCPLVEDSEEIEANSVMAMAEVYKNQIFPDLKVEILYGKMKSKEKDAIMEEFKNGNIDILISTTVIEVGVNVPNASIMIIENAERFGLAQLHQLRGRVGRGEYESFCFLKCEGKSEISRQRMKVMCETNNGFVISEKDLELRGSGEFFGTRQHGLPEFKIANLFEDIKILKAVQETAFKVINDDPYLEKEENKPFKDFVEKRFNERLEI